MRIAVVGTGGREHVLAWRIAQDGHDVVLLGGNPGTAAFARNIAVDAADLDGIVTAAKDAAVELVVVGPEAPLADGLADRARAAGLATFGPNADGARLEASKAYAKEVMARADVPTARSVTATDLDTALGAVRNASEPLVVKADGLAAGKGVTVCETRGEAERAVRECFDGRFGAAGAKVVIEEFLEGQELSVLVVCDGSKTRFAVLPPAQDHKAIGEGDTGPNTGGMGAYTPVPAATSKLLSEVCDTVIEPTLWSLGKDDIDYRGVLYCGLMLTQAGPYVIEFNCRFGDPEAQAVLPVVAGDLGQALASAAHGALKPEDLRWDGRAAMTVVAAADGYPESPRKGDLIEGLDAAARIDDAVVFHAGTKATPDGIVTNGGRVLTVTGVGADLADARDRAYAAIDKIRWDGMYVRRDIGHRALPR